MLGHSFWGWKDLGGGWSAFPWMLWTEGLELGRWHPPLESSWWCSLGLGEGGGELRHPTAYTHSWGPQGRGAAEMPGESHEY